MIVNITSGGGATIGTPSSATVNILDNDGPLATNDSLTEDEDTVITGNVLGNDSDPNEDELTAELVDAPWFGVVDLDPNGSFTYTPNENFFGTDVFTYEVSDGTGGTDTATVTITTDPVDEDPVIDDQEFSLSENLLNGTIVGFVQASDPDFDQELTYSITAGNSAGAFAIDSATGMIYVADSEELDFETTTAYALTVQVTDNGSSPRSESATVDIVMTNLAEDEDEADRITWLNEGYEHVNTILEGDEVEEIHGLNPNDPDGPTGELLTRLTELNNLAIALQNDVLADDALAYEGHLSTYNTAHINYAFVEFGFVSELASEAIRGSLLMVKYSEGDLLRIQGVGGLLNTLGGYLTTVKNSIITTRNSTINAYNQLLNDYALIDLTLSSAITNYDLDVGKINSLLNSIANYGANAPSFEDPGEFDPPILDFVGVGPLNDAADAIATGVNSAVYGATLTAIATISTDGTNMLAEIDEEEDTVYVGFTQHQNSYNSHLDDLMGTLTAQTTVAIGEVDPEADYGVIGDVLRNTDATLFAISTGDPENPGALELANSRAEFWLGEDGVDKLRVKGLDEWLRLLDGRLNQIRLAIQTLQTQVQAIRNSVLAANNDTAYSAQVAQTYLDKYSVILGAIDLRRTAIAAFRNDTLAPLLND